MKLTVKASTGLKTINKATFTLLPAVMVVAVAAARAYAGEGGEAEGPSTMDWVWRIVNFAVVAGLLAYFLTGKIKAALQARIEGIENSLAEAKAAREEALKRLADVESRLKDKDSEIAAMLKQAEENGEKEKALLIAEGEKTGQAILASAKDNIGAELNKAKESIRKEAALLAIELADKIVRENIKKEDQARIAEEYIAKVGG